MGIIEKIEDKRETEETLKFVVSELIPFLTDLFGKPQWMIKPKEGQKPEKILEQYVEVIKPYRKEAVIQRAGEIGIYRDTRNFPTPSHIRARLKPEDLKYEETVVQREKVSGGFNPENFLMSQDANRKFNVPDYQHLVRFVLDERLPECIGASEADRLYRLERDKGMYGIRFKTAWNNHLFDDREQILPLISRRRNGETVNIPLLPDEPQCNSDFFDMGA